MKLLVANGVHATPMSAIAKAANTGMGTIYNYFSNKEILINAIYVHIKQQQEAKLVISASKKTIKSKFEQYYTLVLVSYLDHPDYFRFMDQLQGSPIITKESRDEGYRTINPILEVLKQGQKEKIIKNIELDELLQFLGGSILSYLRWIIDEKDGKMKKASFKNQLSLTWDAIKK